MATKDSALSTQHSALQGRRPWWNIARRQALSGYLLVLPVCLVLLALVAYPFIYAIWISFTSRVVGNPGEFVGLANFRYLLNFQSFTAAIQNTILLVIVTDGLKLVIGLGLALLLNEQIRGAISSAPLSCCRGRCPASSPSSHGGFCSSPLVAASTSS